MVQHSPPGDVEIRFFHPDARRVYLVGDFNDWCIGANPMTYQGNGQWVCRLHLVDGAYQFRFFADGEWFVDHPDHHVQPAACACNSAIMVRDDRVPAMPVG